MFQRMSTGRLIQGSGRTDCSDSDALRRGEWLGNFWHGQCVNVHRLRFGRVTDTRSVIRGFALSTPLLSRIQDAGQRAWFVLLTVVGTVSASGAAERLDVSKEAAEFRLGRDVTYLASDELEGRGVRTRGIDLAADFIAKEFAAAGLRCDAYHGTPFHEFSVMSPGSTGAVQSLVWSSGDDKQTLSLNDDYTSLMVTSSGNFDLPLAFVGYGITDAGRGYDDYAGLDVRGHAVIVLRQEPQVNLASSPFDGVETTDHSYLLTKIRNAVRHGAAAVVVCSPASQIAKHAVDGAAADPLLEVELTTGLGTETLPVVHCRRAIIDRWLKSTLSTDLATIEGRIDETLRPQSALLPDAKLQGRIALTRQGKKLRNVVALLDAEGASKDETIVIGAHYDHLGRGGWGSLALGANDEIHNGADDNASGTAVLMEAARQLGQLPRQRRILFIAFTGEELGLYGSKRYVQTPLVPLNQTVAMLNLDMVGRLRNDQLTVYGTGTANEWPRLLTESAEVFPLKLIGKPSGFGPSDHAPFYERGVPVLHLFTGFHPEYHRPGDDTPLVNISGMQRIAGFLVDLVQRIDRAPQRLQPSSHDQPFQFAEVGDLDGLLTSDLPVRPRKLGVLLQPLGDSPGLEIREVQPDSAAKRLGLLPGDVLLKINQAPLTSAADLTAQMQKATRGERLVLEFTRGGIVRELDLAF